jgi:hypothetical protein
VVSPVTEPIIYLLLLIAKLPSTNWLGDPQSYVRSLLAALHGPFRAARVRGISLPCVAEQMRERA